MTGTSSDEHGGDEMLSGLGACSVVVVVKVGGQVVATGTGYPVTCIAPKGLIPLTGYPVTCIAPKGLIPLTGYPVTCIAPKGLIPLTGYPVSLNTTLRVV
jgi:hypothetical protein